MNRRAFLLAVAALPFAEAAAAQGVDVSGIDAYLQGLRSAEGGFRQTNPNGSTQTGRLFLSRPGRARFEYDRPKGAMVIADGAEVAVFDPRSTRVANRYPLRRSPLSLLLRDDVSLREPGLVIGATRDARGTHVTVVDPRAPAEGRLVMTFAGEPPALREWVLTTRAGERTAVTLDGLRTGVTLDAALFDIDLAAAQLR
jgi:outer membrane lipoprotein-sorting protein